MSDDKEANNLSAAHAALTAADFARANIEKYLEIHGGRAAQFNMKIADSEAGESAHYVMKISGASAHYVMKMGEENRAAQFNMKIAENTVAEMSDIVDRSAALAAKTLDEFIRTRK